MVSHTQSNLKINGLFCEMKKHTDLRRKVNRPSSVVEGPFNFSWGKTNIFGEKFPFGVYIF